ncbi:MAG TPA: hypothetical protein VHZ96_26455 [Frankiaceae bacterium]|jgi:hypothetical protein|nr:hypothetical protein [Frankiaceae bacterium]
MSRRHRPAGQHPFTAAQVLALGPYAWYKAEDLALSDGDAVASWADASVSGYTLTQATSGKRFTYRAAGINGLPAVQGSGANVTAMITGTLPAQAAPVTVFVVGKSPASTPGAIQYLTGGNTAAARRDVYYNTNRTFGLQGGSGTNGSVTAPPSTPFVACGIFDDTSSVLRHDSIPKAATTGTSSPIQIVIGARNGQTASFDGWIGEVIYFAGHLTPAQVMGVERYLSRKWGIPLTQPGVCYVVGVTGDDTNNTGRSPSSPLKTATKANSIIGANDGRIEVTGEIRDQLSINVGQGARLIRLTDCTWYASEKHTSGWTSVGSGVYSKAVTGYGSTLTHCRVVTDLDSDGFWTTLLATTGTQTAPGEGECGISASTIYVHLAGGADPNTKTIEAAKFACGIFSSSPNQVVVNGYGEGAVSIPFTLDNPRGMSQVIGANIGNIEIGAAGLDGRMIVNNVMSLYGNEGFTTQNDATSMTNTDCVSARNLNDGFGVHGTTSRAVVMTNNRCEGAFNNDEGASPHNDVILNDTDGYYHDNENGGGVTGVQNAQMNLLRTRTARNMSKSPPSASQGGISFDSATMSGSAVDCVCEDNNGPGLYSLAPATAVTVAGLVSSGNAEPDVLPV